MATHSQRRLSLGAQRRSPRTTDRFPAEEVELVREALAAGTSKTDIAWATGMSRGRVVSIADRLARESPPPALVADLLDTLAALWEASEREAIARLHAKAHKASFRDLLAWADRAAERQMDYAQGRRGSGVNLNIDARQQVTADNIIIALLKRDAGELRAAPEVDDDRA